MASLVATTVNGNLTPSANGTHNLGASTAYWKNAYLEDTAINGTLYAGGTLTAAGNLDIAQYLRHTGDTNTQIRFESSQITIGTSGGCRMSFNADEKLYFYTGTTPTLALTLDTSQAATFAGTVKIGSATTTGGKLMVSSSDNTVYDASQASHQRDEGSTLMINNESTTAGSFSQLLLRNRSSNVGGCRIVSIDSGADDSELAIVTGDTNESMRILGDGNVGIGTTNPGQLLEVGNDGNSDYALIGPTKIGGGMGHGDYAGFSHRSMGGTSNYCLLQYSDGNTYLNAASGKTIHLRVSNSNILKVTGSLATFDVGALFNGYIELDAGLKDKDGSFGTNGYVLTTDGSGDVTWAASPGAGSVDGTGTAGKMTKWSDSDTVTDSSFLSESGSQLTNTASVVDCTTSSFQLRLSNYGRLGVGTNSASSPFISYLGDGSTWSGDNALIRAFNGGDRGAKGHANGSNLFKLDFSDACAMIVNKDGKVGIGTAAPNSTLDVLIAARSTTFAASNGATWHDLIVRNPNNTQNAAVGLAFELNSTYHSNAAAGIAAVKEVGSSDYGAGLAFVTRPQSAVAEERVRITASGSVGIGTASPDSKLEIAGGNYNTSLKIKGAGSNTGIQFEDSDGNTDGYIYAISGTIGFLDTGADWTIQSKNDDYIRFSTNGNTEHMRIVSDGNVGIGTDAPASKLHLYEETNNTNTVSHLLTIDSMSSGTTAVGFGGGIQFRGERSGGTLQGMGRIQCIADVNTSSNLSSALTFHTATSGVNSEKVRISNLGSVGIGTDAPVTLLDVYHATHSQVTISSAGNQDSSLSLIEQSTSAPFGSASVYGFQWKYDGGDNKLYLSSGVDTNVVNRLTVQRDDGNVGIGGVTAPSTKLHVEGQGTFANNGANIILKNTWSSGNQDILFGGGSVSTGAANNTAARIRSLATAPGGAATGDLLFTVNSGDTFVDALYIQEDGKVGIGTATPYRNLHIYQAANSDNFEGALQTGGTSAALGGYFGYNSTSSGRLSIISLNNTGGANAKIYLGFGLDGDGSPTTEVMTLDQNKLVTFGGGLQVPNQGTYSGLNTSGTSVPLLAVTSSNELMFGSNAVGNAGHPIRFLSKYITFEPAGALGVPVETMRVTNGTAISVGSVGIGTDAPTRLLTLENNTGTVVNQSQLRINNAGAGDSYIYMYAGADWSFGIDNSDADKFKFNISNDVSDGTEVLTLQRDGNVGIGTDNPLTPLHIYTDSASAREIFFDNDGSGEVGITFRTDRKTNGALTGFIRFDANDAGDNNTRYATIEAYSDDVTGGAEDGRLTFSTMVGATDTETMHIVGGNVGIGTDAPGQLLHVYKAGVLEPNFQSTTGRVGLQLNAGAAGDVSWILYSGYPAAGDFNIRESGVANHFVIKKTTGSVGIGIATPDHNLHVSYASTVTDTTAGFLSGTAGPGIRLQNTSNTASTYFPIDFRCSDADARIAFQYSGVSNQGQIIFITEANSTSPKFGIYDRGDGATKILVNDTATSTAPTKTFHAKWSSSNTAADSGEGFLGGTAGTGVLLENTNSTAGIYANLDFRAYDADARIAVKRDAANTADFWFVQDNNGAAKHTVVIKANGCVGIGTHTPANLFNVYGGNDIDPSSGGAVQMSICCDRKWIYHFSGNECNCVVFWPQLFRKIFSFND
jgi:hypothetical protein